MGLRTDPEQQTSDRQHVHKPPATSKARQARPRCDADDWCHAIAPGGGVLTTDLIPLQDSLHGFPRLFTVTSEHIRLYFLVFLLPLHLLVVGSVQ